MQLFSRPKLALVALFLASAAGSQEVASDPLGPFLVRTPAQFRCFDDICEELQNAGLHSMGVVNWSAAKISVPAAEVAKARELSVEVQKRDGIQLRPSKGNLVTGPASNPDSSNVFDPSELTPVGGNGYVFFETGRGIGMARSANLRSWSYSSLVLSKVPGWLSSAVPGGDGWFWSPAVFFDRSLHMWVILYGYSEQGKGRPFAGIGFKKYPNWPYTFSDRPIVKSAIGAVACGGLLADSRFTDLGKVCSSDLGDSYNALEPCAAYDERGQLWLAFGWDKGGIRIVQLDPNKLAPTGRSRRIASGLVDDMQSPFIWRSQGYYFLFYSRGTGEEGQFSTHRICVGRSKQIWGPYRDKDGHSCDAGGETIFLQSMGAIVAPTKAGVSPDGKTFSFGFLDADWEGAPSLGLADLSLDRSGWPVLSNFRL